MRPALRYTLVMSSLPHLPSLFALREIPLSRLQLNQRLRMLEPTDAATLRHIQAMMSWGRLSLETTDQHILSQLRQLLNQLDGRRFLQELIIARFELLTIVAALRRRHRDEAAPPRGLRWGYERWVSHIERHWKEPGFGLEKAFPWIVNARSCLEHDDTVGLERLLMATAWDHLGRAGEGHYFDFEAVVIYALRFDLIASWAGWDRTASRAHFLGLLEAELGECGDLFAV
nr:hypothetical protein [Gammaproteobacteria bacterium]